MDDNMTSNLAIMDDNITSNCEGIEEFEWVMMWTLCMSREFNK